MSLFKKKSRVYLDCAASQAPRACAVEAFTDALSHTGNPGSPHAEGRDARAVLEDARETIAHLAEVKPDAVIFTGNATEANALAIQGRIEALRLEGRAYEEMQVLYDAGAHSSLSYAVEALERKGVRTQPLIYTNASLDLVALGTLLTTETVLVCVSAVCGETGIITPVRDIRRVLDAVSSLATLHVDASQLPLVAPFELTRLGADTLALDAQKVGGVRGIGALIAPRRISLAPLMRGGGQERGLRPGTPSEALATAFARALTETHDDRASFLESSKEFRELLVSGIKQIPNTVANEGRLQAPHILNVSFMGRDTDYLVALMDEAGVALSTRSSCEADAEGSRAVRTIFNDTERAECTLRISWGPETTKKDIERTLSTLISSVEFLDDAGILKA